MPPASSDPAKRGRGRPSTRVEARCLGCGASFGALPSELARGGGRYCGATCRDRANGRGKSGRPAPDEPVVPPVEVRCETCGGCFLVFPSRVGGARPARFCSVPCYRKRPLGGSGRT